MSVESEILRIQHNIANTYAAVSEKGGEVPLQPNSANLAAAVASIPAGESAGEVYSTEETRIGTWIDGKPLYRKVYRKVVGNSELEEIANLSSLQIDFVSHIYGVFDQIEGEGTYPKSWESANHMYPSGNASALWISSPNLLRCANPNRTSSRITAIIEYTKTTDLAPTQEVTA